MLQMICSMGLSRDAPSRTASRTWADELLSRDFSFAVNVFSLMTDKMSLTWWTLPSVASISDCHSLSLSASCDATVRQKNKQIYAVKYVHQLYRYPSNSSYVYYWNYVFFQTLVTDWVSCNAFVWHPESLDRVAIAIASLHRLQPMSKVNAANPGSRLRWSIPTWWTTPSIQQPGLTLPWQQWQPFPYESRSLCGLSGTLQTLICTPVVRPKKRLSSSLTQVLDAVLEGASRLRPMLQILCNILTLKWSVSATSSNPALLPSWMVVCLSYTLLIILLLPGWPTMDLNSISKKMKNEFV